MIKKINTKFFSTLKGKILRMVKSKKILLVALSSVIVLTGCVNKQATNDNSFFEHYYNESGYYQQEETSSNSEYDIYVENDSTSSSNAGVEIEPTPIIETKLDEEMLKVIRTEVTLSSDSLKQFISEVKSIKVNYLHSDLFGSALALQKYNTLKEYESSACKYIINGRIDKNLIRQTVLNNNKRFLEEYAGNRYSELDSVTFDKVLNIFIEGLEDIISNNTDLGQLDEKLGDLKILHANISGSGEMTDDKTILGINLKVIDTYTERNPKIDYIRTVVLHETNHFGQIHSENERSNEGYNRNLGISYSWNDLKVNPLNYTWYTEGSAELLMTTQYGEEISPTVYEGNIRSLDTLTLSALLRNDVDELTLARLSYQTDLNELFKIFNCSTDEDKIEVINMMYAYDISLNQNREFFDAYKEKYGAQIENRYDYFSSLHGSIAQTLTKNFYINLSNYLITNNATLEDIFSNICIFETEMSRLTKYTQSNYIEENTDFIAMYRDTQMKFFGIIAEYFGLETADIINFYNAYYGDSLSNTSTTSTLTENELTYVNNILDSRSSSKRNTVNEVSESFKIK